MFVRKNGRISASVLVCIALVACAPTANTRNAASGATTPRMQVDKALPTPQRAPIQAGWWQKFSDPLMTVLIQEALQANPDIKTAQANLRSARAQRAITSASLLPSLSAGASARHSGGTDSFGATLDASWEADIFGGNQLATRAADADVQASQANLEDVKASLAAEVASNYVNLRLAQAKLAVAKQSLASRNQTAHLTGLKQQAGLASGLELEQSKLSVGQSEAQIPSLENSVTQAQNAIALLTGATPQAMQARLAAVGEIPSVAEQVADAIPANAIRQRPDIRAAEYKVQAAKLRIGEAQANQYPSFNLGGSLSASSLNLGDLLDPASIARSLLASISAPLFDGGKLKQQVVVKDAAYQQAVASYQKAVLSALQDVANGFADLATVRQQQPILVQNVALARNTEKLAKLSYDAGTADFQNVLDAQRNVLSAQDSVLSAQAAHSQAVIALYKAVGGAW